MKDETLDKNQGELASSRLLADTVRMNWLNENGRVTKFTDGWNAWSKLNPKKTSINHDIRMAIDEARNYETTTKTDSMV